jgi:protein-S-isoprenylcysteine O-methyltransferase Ste14
MESGTVSHAQAADDAAASRRGTLRLAVFSLAMPVVLFASAGRLDWGMGWVFVALMLAATMGTRLVLSRVRPDLVAERSTSFGRADVKPWDRVLVLLLGLVLPAATWVVAGLSHRYGWVPHVPLPGQLAATAALLGGMAFTVWAMASNRFFSAVVRIQADRGQHVVTSGPYRFVRHPGYAGSALVTAAVPVMLDAVWALVPAAATLAVLVVRTALEDRTLRAELHGYTAYAASTRFRLVPGIW